MGLLKWGGAASGFLAAFNSNAAGIDTADKIVIGVGTGLATWAVSALIFKGAEKVSRVQEHNDPDTDMPWLKKYAAISLLTLVSAVGTHMLVKEGATLLLNNPEPVDLMIDS